MTELDTFLQIMTHELKQPLSTITSSAELLRRYHRTMPAERVEASLRTIAQTGYQMGWMLDQFLLLSSMSHTAVELKPLHMASIVAKARQRLVDMIDENQVEVILPTTWPTALGHDLWIEAVWINYLSNAIKYGGQPPRLELGATTQGDGMVRFWVHDNGPGLTQKDQVRLFTPFTRLDPARADGYGLGLSIVRWIVEKLGGQVQVESDAVVGQGSVFSFTLPPVPIHRE
jgi:signal transduction histidine kinase